MDWSSQVSQFIHTHLSEQNWSRYEISAMPPYLTASAVGYGHIDSFTSRNTVYRKRRGRDVFASDCGLNSVSTV